MKQCKIIDLPKIQDPRGNLTFLQNPDHLPFKVERVFWIYDVPGGEVRGGHAFKKQEEVIIAISGSFDVVIDNGNVKQVFHLNRSYKGLHVPAGKWRSMENFSTNSLALVLASTPYNEDDYIRSYEEFINKTYSSSTAATIKKKKEERAKLDMTQTSIDDCTILELDINHKDKGNITVVENDTEVPFDINRVYYLYDVPGGEDRGGHAHKDLYQLIIAAGGSFDITLDDGKNKKKITLNRPYQGLYVVPGIWRDIDNFSSGSTCLVLASHTYNESDYLRDYKEFLIYKGNSNNKMGLKLIDYNREILDKSWSWLNDPEIKLLIGTPIFTREGQDEWFKSLPANKNYLVKGISFSDKTIGVAGLKNIDLNAGSAEYFGYIGEKEYWGKGLGGKILQEIIDLAREKLSLKLIYLNVVPANIRAIKAYDKFGFRMEFITDANIKMFYKI